MRFIGNIIWFIFGGLASSLLWCAAGLLFCITIIGIPLGIQAFKLAGFVLWPFGKEIAVGSFSMGGTFGNIIWIVLCGLELAIVHLLTGIVYLITIIGIPFGWQHFKIAKLALLPFGAEIHHVN